MPKVPEKVGVKISALDNISKIGENDVVPLNSVGVDGSQLTNRTTLMSLRQNLNFENAYLSVAAALNDTIDGETFFVYEDASKLWVLQYQRVSGNAVSVVGYDNQQVRLPTQRLLRAAGEIAGKSGAAKLFLTSGSSVETRLEQTNRIYRPEDFFVAGETDHTEAFKRMALAAESDNATIVASGNYIVTSTPNGISLKVNADFSQATITCKTKENVAAWMQTTSIFKITQPEEDISSALSAGVVSGTGSLPLTEKSGFVKLSSNDIVMVRFDGDSPGNNQLKAETNEIDRNGLLKYSQHYDFTAGSLSAVFKPYLPTLTVKLPTFILDGAYIRSILTVTRNNVEVLGGLIKTVNKGHCQAYIEQDTCCNFRLNGINTSLDYSTSNEGGYLLTYKYTCNTKIENITMLNGWSGTDGNYARDIRARNCDALTIGGHFSMADIEVESCRIKNHCRAQGWGYFKLLNCTHTLADGAISQPSLATRRDYGNSWEGTLTVRNLTVRLGAGNQGYYIVSAQEPKFNHSFIGTCPEIDIDTVNIEFDRFTGPTSGTMEIRGIDLGVSGGNGFEKYQILPRQHSIKRVRLLGNNWFNRIDFRPVYNNRNYYTLTTEEISAINGSHFRYTCVVEDIIAEKAGRSDSAGFYGVHTFPIGLTGPKQFFYIRRSDNCIPVLKSRSPSIVHISDSELHFGAVEGYASRSGNDYNEIYFQHCVVYEPQVRNGGTNRCCLLHFEDTKFDWLANSGLSTNLTASDFQADLGGRLLSGTSGVVVRVQGCWGRLESGSYTYNTAFKGYITGGYKAGGYLI